RGKRPFKFAFSFSGIYLEQCQRWCPQLLSLYKDLYETGCLELVSQTYFHSLSSIFYGDMGEFKEQARQHVALIKDLVGAEPRVFENTELIFNNLIARAAFELGFTGIITEGSSKILAGRSPHQVYHSKVAPDSRFCSGITRCRTTSGSGFRRNGGSIILLLPTNTPPG
ncbi:MAG: hypothetical protein JTT11_05815, partial [Candidatus Brockarchaeota archaeon]|nr:hypothetical protein [Candidatus Brockarchaeota archaeon]